MEPARRTASTTTSVRCGSRAVRGARSHQDDLGVYRIVPDQGYVRTFTESATDPISASAINLQVPATSAGYEQLSGYIRSLGSVRLVGIEGTSSYGAGLSRYLRTRNVEIREIIRPRRSQRRCGKSDPIDAYAATQQTLTEPDTLPQAKTGDGLVEQIRVLLAVRRSAIKARVAVIRQIKSLLATAPDPVRARWAGANERRMVEELAATRPGAPTASVGAATGYALRRLARRHQYLSGETDLEKCLRELVGRAAPAMIATK